MLYTQVRPLCSSILFPPPSSFYRSSQPFGFSPAALMTIHVSSVERTPPPDGEPLIQAGDGCLCSLTIVELLADQPLWVPLCSVCHSSDRGIHKAVELQCKQTYEIILGQSPDQSSSPGSTTYPDMKSVLEFVLLGSKTLEVIRVTGNVSSDCSPASDENGVSQCRFELSIRLDSFLCPPVCHHHPTTQNDSDDPRITLTSDWNPEMATFWHHRAHDLKHRGNWLVQAHKSTNPWSSAFSCYSRAYQLATLSRRAIETCASSDVSSPQSVHYVLPRKMTQPGAINLTHPSDCQCDPPVDSLQDLVQLEFSLLLNLALCQMKAGSPEAVVNLCSQALALYPKSRSIINGAGNASSFSREQSSILSDVAKCMYRRAQGYMSWGKHDEALPDLEGACSLYDQLGETSKLSCCKQLLSRAQYKLSQEDAILRERFRRHRDMLESL